jgi:hypothetical protein
VISFKSMAVAAVLAIGLGGAALAQTMPGMAGTPGRGNSQPTTTMPNGAPMSNGQTAEPGMRRGQMMRSGRAMRPSRAMRSRGAMRSRSMQRGRSMSSQRMMRRPMRGSPNSPNSRPM